MFPAFQSLYEVPKAIGAEVRFWNLDFEKNFIPDIKELEQLIDNKTKLIILNSPHNPTGIVLKKPLLKQIATLAKTKNIKIIADEHYRFLPLNKEQKIIDSLRDIDKNIICTGSFIKCFGLMGLRIGWIIADQNLLKKCRDYKDYLTHVTPPISDFLAEKALLNKEKLIKRSQDIVKQNYKNLTAWLKNNTLFKWVPAEAGVVTFLKFKQKTNSEDFCKQLIKKQEVFLLPGTSFEMEGYVRLGFGYAQDNFKEALKRIDKFSS